MLKLGHNPFTRETLVRQQVHGKCFWCGGQNKHNKVYRYFLVPDGIMKKENAIGKGVFCSIGCFNSYNF